MSSRALVVLKTAEDQFDQDQPGGETDGKVIIAELASDSPDDDPDGGGDGRKSTKHDCYDQELGTTVDIALNGCFEFLHRVENPFRRENSHSVWSEYTGLVGCHRVIEF